MPSLLLRRLAALLYYPSCGQLLLVPLGGVLRGSAAAQLLCSRAACKHERWCEWLAA